YRERLAADVCVWESGGLDTDDRPLMYLGLRGIVAVTLRVRTIKSDAHSGMYSYLPNAAWRLVWALSTLKDQQERILIPGFYDDVRPPTARQRELLAAMPLMDEDQKAFYEITRFAGNLSGQALKESAFLPTCTINGLSSGYQGEGTKTIIPAEASCKIDFRLAPEQDPKRVVRQLRAHLDAQGFDDIEVIVEPGGGKAGIVDPDDPYVQLAIETARTVYSKEPVVTPLDGGSGPYATFLEHLHAPIVISGVSYPGCLAHSPNEHIRIADWLLGTKHMAHMLARIDQR
ncbi:MAG: M20/M25/M40 family metallo-hydrolase, partial [Ktedonobacterales bacterium]